MNKNACILAMTLAALPAAGTFAAGKTDGTNPPVLQYLGHASLCIEAGGKVIYIDPYIGSYDKDADLILVTHQHPDHNRTDLVKKRSGDCRIITEADALKDGRHQSFDLGYVKVESVSAGGNRNHSESNCTGYLLTFANGVSLYVSGDTSTVSGMAALKQRKIDYAFFCCDGFYNMDAEEATECAETVGARHSIPYHTKPGSAFDMTTAKKFNGPGRLILEPGQKLELSPER